MDKYHQTQRLLAQLEAVLRRHSHWQNVSPTPSALASCEPFAIDTLACHQWLQWIFIPKLGMLISQRQPLPANFAITPYIEEAMKAQSGMAEIVAVTHQIDQLFKD